ncbi:MAG: tyrosine-type recombinase/integrase, partial [Myxococcota bacterium]|nr:tyrosine-type recombinase/integrase [Myxococcota bacterium]
GRAGEAGVRLIKEIKLGSIYNRGTKKTPNWWLSWYEPNGRRRAKKIGPDRVLAKRVLARIEDDIIAGRYGIETDDGSASRAPLFEDVIPPWVEARRATHRAFGDDRSRVNRHLIPFFGRLHLDEIGPAEVKGFVAAKRGKFSPQTVINCLNVLSRFFNDRIEDGEDLINPVARLDRSTRRSIGPRYDPRKTPFLKSKDDIRALYLAMPALAPKQPVRAMFAVGVFAGLRTDEILGLPKSGVDIERRTLMVDRSARGPLKDDESRIAPINDSLLVVLRGWMLMAPPGELLFPPTKGRGAHMRPHTLWRHLKVALAACRLSPMTWYQCTRHTFASHYVMDGGSIEKLQMILGHASITTTQRYAHLVPGQFDRRDYGAACVDVSDPRVLPFGGAKEGTNCYAGATRGFMDATGFAKEAGKTA